MIASDILNCFLNNEFIDKYKVNKISNKHVYITHTKKTAFV